MGRLRDRHLTPAEARLWRAVVKDAVPLPGHALPVEDEPSPALPQSGGEGRGEGVSPFAASSVQAPPLPLTPTLSPSRERGSSSPLAHGHTPGVDRRTADRLRRGQLDIEARLDLHGMTQEAAHSALNGFIARCLAVDKRCVLIITGKGQRDGQGILRQAVPRWLNEPGLRPAIIAFSHAQPKDGGEGALYVLLKRRR